MYFLGFKSIIFVVVPISSIRIRMMMFKFKFFLAKLYITECGVVSTQIWRKSRLTLQRN